MQYHLIFEGAELTGKSTVISLIYKEIEKRFNTGAGLLDGCYWFNTDVGLFGGRYGWDVIRKYVEIAEVLKDRNVIFEKFYMSHLVNANLLKHKVGIDEKVEANLSDLNFKVVMVEIDEDFDLMKQRIKDRLNLYPHYKSILHEPMWYFEQQRLMKEIVLNSSLDSLIVNTTGSPDKPVRDILKWLDF